MKYLFSLFLFRTRLLVPPLPQAVKFSGQAAVPAGAAASAQFLGRYGSRVHRPEQRNSLGRRGPTPGRHTAERRHAIGTHGAGVKCLRGPRKAAAFLVLGRTDRERKLGIAQLSRAFVPDSVVVCLFFHLLTFLVKRARRAYMPVLVATGCANLHECRRRGFFCLALVCMFRVVFD